MKLKKLETNKHQGTVMNKNTKLNITKNLTLLALAGFLACVALADTQMETIPFTVKSVSGTGCPGSYTGYAKMTNSTGTYWITPPTNTTSGTLTDMSGFPSPYVSVAYVMRRSDQVTWCGTNSVTFPATNSTSYQLMIVVKNPPPPPTNGQPM